ncbi:MAG: hypothetical protein MHM6MM_000777 [Cercozoa sp. M6MM]
MVFPAGQAGAQWTQLGSIEELRAALPEAPVPVNQGEAQYYFVNREGKQGGPLPASAIGALFDTGALLPTSLCFEMIPGVQDPAQGEWLPLNEQPALCTVTGTPFADPRGKAVWKYVDAFGGEQGPVTLRQLQRLYALGEVDGHTKVKRLDAEHFSELDCVPSLSKVKDRKNNAFLQKSATQQAIQRKQRQQQQQQQQVQGQKRNRKKRRKPAQQPAIYISGLPKDTTPQEVADFCRRVGVIAIDLVTGEDRVRLYRDDAGALKGDACVEFEREESVQMAEQLLDESQFRVGVPVHVSRRTNDNNSDEGSSEGVARKKRETTGKHKMDRTQLKRLRELRRAQQQQKLSWSDGADRALSKYRIVVLKPMFDARLISQRAETRSGGDMLKKEDIELKEYESIEREVQQGCAECGEVRKVIVFKGSDVGAVAVKFADASGATTCIERMRGRLFDGRRLQCDHWDGITDYGASTVTDEAEEERRQAAFANFIERSES